MSSTTNDEIVSSRNDYLEQNLEQKLYNHFETLPEDIKKQCQGNPDKILQIIDDLNKKEFMMHVGSEKGEMVVDLIRKHQPKTFIELGGYMGFSALMFGKELHNDGKLYSFELNPEYAKIAQYFINLAGLTDKIEIVLGKCAENLVKFQATHSKVDMAFIDHWYDLYVPDLRLMESLGLVQEGTLIVADNIKYPGAPEYPKYVQGTREYKQKICDTEPPSVEGYKGNPALIYKSHTAAPSEGFWDTMEFTECTGIAK